LKLCCYSAAVLKYPLNKALEYIAKAGYSYVEFLSCNPSVSRSLWGFEGHTLPIGNGAKRASLKEKLKALDLKAVTVCPLYEDANYLSLDKNVKKKTMKITRDHIDFGQDLEMKLISIFLGEFRKGSFFQAWDACVETMREVGDYAKSSGITVVIENGAVHRHLVTVPEDLAKLIDDINHPAVKAIADLANAVMGCEDPVLLVRVLGNRIRHVHTGDNEGGVLFQHLTPGKGKVPYAECYRALKEIGYEGYVSVEIFNPEDPLGAMIEGKKVIERYL